MPVHTIATYVENATESKLFLSAAALILAVALKVWSGGRSCTRERDWAGKMILIVVSILDEMIRRFKLRKSRRYLRPPLLV